MPAPFTIVTFTDDEGDEFPVRVGAYDDRTKTLVEARKRLEEFENAGELKPTHPLSTQVHMKYMGGHHPVNEPFNS